MDERSFIWSLPQEIRDFAFQVVEEGLAEVGRLQKLKEEGTSEEKARAAQQLEQLGVPGVWFCRRFSEKYPGFTEEQMHELFGWAHRATLY